MSSLLSLFWGVGGGHLVGDLLRTMRSLRW
jgi:hypothetical protein